MRINRLILQAFGHFSDKVFDFGAAQPGKSDFHIIYGRNEAGKTTFMEAWLRLLFGIELQEKYAFHSPHQRRDLKLSALLEADGKEYAVIRQPQGRSSVLLDKDGANVEAWLRPFLRNFNGKEDYRNRLCLDDEVIEKGAKEIMEGKGELGDLLFSSAAGIPALSRLLEEEQTKAAAIYKSAGHNKNTRMRELKQQYEAVKQQITDADMSAGQYQDLREKLARAVEEEENCRQQRQAADAKKAALTSMAEKYRDLQAQDDVFADKLNAIVEKLAVLGLPEERLRADSSIEVYHQLRPFILTSEQIEALRQAREEITGRAKEQAEIKDRLQENEQDYAAAQQALAQLEQNLPPQAEYDKMTAALRDYQAGSLKQAYRAAQERVRAAQERAQAALAGLSTVQGAHFTALPAADLSARDGERLLEERRTASSAYEAARSKEAEILVCQNAVKARLAELQTKGKSL